MCTGCATAFAKLPCQWARLHRWLVQHLRKGNECRRKKDHGRAEAFLLAAWAAMHLPAFKAEYATTQASLAAEHKIKARHRRAGVRAEHGAQHDRLLELQAAEAVQAEPWAATGAR